MPPPATTEPAPAERKGSSGEKRQVDRIDGRYVIGPKLGAGGMASVWCARDERLGRDVALKVLHRNLPFSASMRERLEREARVAAGLTHGNVVQVYDFAIHEDRDSFIAMELVGGRTLRSYLEDAGCLPSFPAALIAYEISRGLGYAHAHGVVHRDVKPDNVLISDRGTVKVADFGIAMADELARLTATGIPVGTPAYLSPEQVKGEPASPRSDVFSFGVLLYETLTGQLPFHGTTPSALMYRIVEGEYAAPETLVEVERDLAAVVRRCLRGDPRARFADATEVGEALRPLLQRWSVVDPRATLAAYVTEGRLRGLTSRDVDDLMKTVPPPAGPRRRDAWYVGAGVAGLAVATALVIARIRPSPEIPPPAAPIAAAPAPAAEPDPAALVPPGEGSHEKVATPPPQPAAAAAPGILQIVPQATWADVFIDGKAMGHWPEMAKVELPAGEHLIELRNPLCQPFRRRVVIAPGGTEVLPAQLQPLP